MSKRLILCMAMASVCLAPLAAQAETLAEAGQRVDGWLHGVFAKPAAAAPVATTTTTPAAPNWLNGVFEKHSQTDTGATAAFAEPVAPAVHLAAPSAPMVNKDDLAQLAMPSLPPPQADALPEPSIERGLKKFYCVEYARLRSGLSVFGDAKTWWEHARSLYARAAHPVEEAVMVFSGSHRIRHGHVAVVTDIVSDREIRVDQANWQNRGEIDHATPVLDVSTNNDWSKVRVWDIASRQFGSRVYAISGFIMKAAARQASND